MLSARIHKSFAGREDASPFTLDIDLEMVEGGNVLFGPSGSGKTLTLDSIAGFVRPDEGRILLFDEILYDSRAGVHLKPQRRHCGYVFQKYALFPHMTLKQNLEFAAGVPKSLEKRRKVNEMIERFRLGEVAGLHPHEVSGGQKQRCSIARALIGEPRILLLDEPSQGLDATLRAELYAVLRQVRAEFETPILLVTHDLEESFELGDELFVIHQGRLVQQGSPKDVLSKPATAEVAELLGHKNVLSAEIVSLDPGRNSSRLKIDDFEMVATYLPGHLIGDHISVFTRPEDLRAWPQAQTRVVKGAGAAGGSSGAGAGGKKDERLGPNQIPAILERIVALPNSLRLEFEGGLTVTQNVPAPQLTAREWVVEFPPESIRVIGR
ncbi:MAG TPA: ABC transporter ATP-binding protein [Bryobacteraceae bacterium]|jgi:molybdate transport system ATP-binding protein